jgi:hypothetical protein
MASKISDLTDGSALLGSDYTVITRNGVNYKINLSGAIASYATSNPISSNGYQLNTGAYIYNTTDLTLSSLYNGKVVVSNNGSASVITIASGLPSGFSCQVIQNSSGSLTFTGAAGVSMNSYGGLTQIAGRYGSAAIQYTAANSYVLAGNLA